MLNICQAMPCVKGFTGTLFLLLLLCARSLSAAVYPDGVALAATRIPFSTDEVKGASSYVFKVATSRVETDKSFENNVQIERSSAVSSVILQVPAFNKEYSWRVEYYNDKGKRIGKSQICHFNTGPSTVDSSIERHRVRVLTNRYSDSTLMFFLDYASTMYSLSGKAIWHLPDSIAGMKRKEQKRDVKLSGANTVTFLTSRSTFEMDYLGNVVGMSPFMDKDKPFVCHHEFDRLKKGTYMSLGTEMLDRKTALVDANGKTGDSTMRRVEFGTVVEFDTAGKIWEWRAADHFTTAEIWKRKMMNANFEPPMHMNAFHFDEENGFIYVGFRNLNKIIKIKYPEKTVVAEYDGLSKDGKDVAFQRQHSMNINRDGNLYIFNNNSGGSNNRLGMTEVGQLSITDSIPTLVVLKELQDSASGGYKKVWEFDFSGVQEQGPLLVTNGGNVKELPDGNYFVCMGTAGRVLIISRDKEVLYDAVVEKWSSADDKWIRFPQYRASPIYTKELDECIRASRNSHNYSNNSLNHH
jgi:hypothetical protein